MNIETIYDQMLFWVVKIEWDTWTGTWFLVKKTLPENRMKIFIVTNSHVIKDSWNNVWFLIQKTIKEKIFEPGKHIHEHKFTKDEISTIKYHKKYDLCLINISNIQNKIRSHWDDMFYKVIDLDDETWFWWNQEEFEKRDSCIDVTFVWYPNWIIDNKNKTPLIRRASTSTPLHFDYDWNKEFLIDWGIYPWSSWSPVFIHPWFGRLERSTWDKKISRKMESKSLFLWILSYTLIAEENWTINKYKINQKNWFLQNGDFFLNLWWVIKAEVIRDFIQENRDK